MNLGLIERWNAVVAPEDHVIILGDLAMGKRAETVPLLKRCHGSKDLVPGNHDNCWDKGRDGSGTTKSRLMTHCLNYREWGGLLGIMQPPKWVTLSPSRCVQVSHLPPIECGDHKAGEAVYEHEARFVEHRPPYPEGWMLCGHVHEAWRTHGRVVNVGVDVWNYQPVAASTIVELIERGEDA